MPRDEHDSLRRREAGQRVLREEIVRNRKLMDEVHQGDFNSESVKDIAAEIFPAIVPYAHLKTMPTGKSVVMIEFEQAQDAIKQAWERTKVKFPHMADWNKTPEYLLLDTMQTFAHDIRTASKERKTNNCTMLTEDFQAACETLNIPVPSFVSESSPIAARSGNKDHPLIRTHQPGGKE